MINGMNIPKNGFGIMHGANPMMINPCLTPKMNPMAQKMQTGTTPFMMPQMQPIGIMNPCMMPQVNPFMIQGCMIPTGKRQLTEEQKKQLRINGYLVGKQMALQMRKSKQSKMPPKKVMTPKINHPANDFINIQFKKGASTINIKKKADDMVADLLNDYFVKSHTTNGTFKYKGNILSPTDVTSLVQADLQNGAIIYVT